MTTKHLFPVAFAGMLALGGCGGSTMPPVKPAATHSAPTAATVDDGEAAEVAAERAKLTPEDRTLVDAQDWCVVNTNGRLGSMGAPVKLEIKGQPVFLCCAGCKRRAEADSDKTLAKVEELKNRTKAAQSGRS